MLHGEKLHLCRHDAARLLVWKLFMLVQNHRRSMIPKYTVQKVYQNSRWHAWLAWFRVLLAMPGGIFFVCACLLFVLLYSVFCRRLLVDCVFVLLHSVFCAVEFCRRLTISCVLFILLHSAWCTIVFCRRPIASFVFLCCCFLLLHSVWCAVVFCRSVASCVFICCCIQFDVLLFFVGDQLSAGCLLLLLFAAFSLMCCCVLQETSRRLLYFTVPRVVAVSPQMRLVEDNPASISLLDIYKTVRNGGQKCTKQWTNRS